MIISSAQVAVASALALAISFLVIGHIPVGEGAGWDGAVYLDYAGTLGQGGVVTNDFYRFSRMAGFIPLVLASAIGVTHEGLIGIQTFLNIFMISGASALLHDSLKRLGVENNRAVLSTVLMVISWPVLVMSVYYPVLSDHLALSISCLSLWLWTRSNQRSLYALTAYSVWVMPGLFIVPFVLAAMRRDRPLRGTDRAQHGRLIYTIAFLILASVFVAAAIGAVSEFGSVQKYQELSALWGQAPAASLAWISSAYLVATGLFVCWIAVVMGIHSVSLNCSELRDAFKASTPVVLSGCLLWLLALNLGSYGAPPFIEFFLAQTLAAPAKPLVSHFAYFGPVIVLALVIYIKQTRSQVSIAPDALWVVFSCFLPFIAFGSESRQWIAIFPIAIALFAVSERSQSQYWMCLVFSVILVAPMFWLEKSIQAVYATSIDYQEVNWQLYFGRQGPWMSTQSFEYFGIALLAFFAATITCRIVARRLDYCASISRPRI